MAYGDSQYTQDEIDARRWRKLMWLTKTEDGFKSGLRRLITSAFGDPATGYSIEQLIDSIDDDQEFKAYRLGVFPPDERT